MISLLSPYFSFNRKYIFIMLFSCCVFRRLSTLQYRTPPLVFDIQVQRTVQSEYCERIAQKNKKEHNALSCVPCVMTDDAHHVCGVFRVLQYCTVVISIFNHKIRNTLFLTILDLPADGQIMTTRLDSTTVRLYVVRLFVYVL